MDRIAGEIKHTIHELKTWPEYFISVDVGFKNFEVRKDDRSFQVNDFIRLKEWNPDNKSYTGRTTLKQINYILKGGQFGIEKGFVVMGLVPVLIDPEVKIKR